METKRTSRLFAMPSTLLFVEEEVTIVLPALSEAQRIAPEPIDEAIEDDEPEECREPARLFVGLPVAVPEHMIADEPEDDEPMASDSDAPLFVAAPPPIAPQLPSAFAAVSTEPVDDTGDHGNPFVILEIVDDESEEIARPPQALPEPVPLQLAPALPQAAEAAPVPVDSAPSRPAPASEARSLGVVLALAAAAAMVVLWVGG